jgi:S-adenosylmethionine:tRNA ribosyltransferase-isomerase
MKPTDFDYDLPEELIAQTPGPQRDGSRLLTLDRRTGETGHLHFFDLPKLLRPGDCLVLNDSRVLPARLFGRREPDGAAVEVLLLIDRGERVWECLVRPGRKVKEGARLSFGEGVLTAQVIGEIEGGNRLIRFDYEGIFLELLERLGKMPLPPYIKTELLDSERYQTVYSRVVGSAAAPTAGLHFTEEMLGRLKAQGISICFVTLHVGLGTFRPVKEKNITDHIMHAEYCIILPQITLIMLGSALAGREHVLAAYREAVEQRYRFFSFGDAMFIY